jgi:hypothetical protein
MCRRASSLSPRSIALMASVAALSAGGCGHLVPMDSARAVANARRSVCGPAQGRNEESCTVPGPILHQVSAVPTDGRLLLIPGEGYGAAPEMRQEWVFETSPILAADPETGAADTLAVLPHFRRWYGVRGGSPGPIHVKGRAGGFADGFDGILAVRQDELDVPAVVMLELIKP